jgi:multidrug efflux pump subunit AcrA (membrane-fusion protein)
MVAAVATVVKAKHRKRRTWIIIGGVVIVVALIAALIGIRVSSRMNAASGDLTTTVSRGTVTSSVAASGQLVDQYTYSVAPGATPVLTQQDGVAATSSASSSTSSTASTGSSATSAAGSGSTSSAGASAAGYKTTAIDVHVGDGVTANQTLATATLTSAGASDLATAVSNATAAVNNANAALSYDQSTYTSETTLANITTASLNAAQKQISADYVAINTAKSSLTTANENLATQNVTITSPVNGYILSLGTAVNASAAQVATIGAGARLVSVMVSELQIASVQVGQQVAVTLGSSSTPFAGTVSSIAVAPTASSGVETYQVLISSTVIPATGRVGMTVTATIAIASHPDVLNVPASAISTSGGHSVVTVVPARGKPIVTPVTLGLVGDSSVEIVSGLASGDRVITGATGTVPVTSTNTGIGGRL